MQLTFDTPVPAADEAAALSQALHQVSVLHAGLENLCGQLVPLNQPSVPPSELHFEFEYTPDRQLVSISATTRPEALDS